MTQQLFKDEELKPEIAKQLSELMAAPMVFHPGGWEDTVPAWIKRETVLQRFRNPDDDMVPDVEVVAYLYTASLVAPMGHDWAEIYLYLTTQLMQDKMPPDIRRDSITQYQEGLLRDLKYKMRSKQKRMMKGRRYKC